MRCKGFTEDIGFSNSQIFDHMRLILYGSPAVDHVSILIQNRKGCSVQLHACGQIGFCHLDSRRLVLLNRFQFNGLDVLSLIGGIKFQYLIRGYKTVRCGNLFYIISSKRQVQGKVCLSFFIACDLL